MRMTQLFTRTLKQAPAGEVARNAQLLIRAGYVHKTMAGVYSFLPLGLRVLENIKQIVREEMDRVNSQELVMSTLQRRNYGKKLVAGVMNWSMFGLSLNCKTARTLVLVGRMRSRLSIFFAIT